jgi:hypothetical protein
MSGEVGSHFRISETPADKILAFFVLATTLTRLDAARSMLLMHSIKPLADASERNGNVDEVREVPLDGFGVGAAFVAGH